MFVTSKGNHAADTVTFLFREAQIHTCVVLRTKNPILQCRKQCEAPTQCCCQGCLRCGETSKLLPWPQPEVGEWLPKLFEEPKSVCLSSCWNYFQLVASCVKIRLPCRQLAARRSRREEQIVKFSLPKRSEYCSKKQGTRRGNNDSLEIEMPGLFLCKPSFELPLCNEKN